MADDVIYWLPMRAVGGVTKQMRCILAGIGNVNNRNRMTAPADKFIRIPDTAVKVSGPSRSGYEGQMAIGKQEAAMYTMEWVLSEVQGSTELDRLRDALTHYEHPTAGSLYLGTDGTVTFPTSNVFWILTDHGDPANRDANGDPNVCEFIGVQRAEKGSEGVMNVGISNYVQGGSEPKFSLVDIFTAVFSTVTMDWVAKAARGFVTYDAPWKTGEYVGVVDIGYLLSGTRYYVEQWPENQLASFYTWAGLWEAVQHCCDGVFKSLLRYGGGSGAFLFISATETEKASPWDHWTHYRQNKGANHQRGAALDRDEIGLMGAIRTATGEPPFAGLYYPGQDGYSLHGPFQLLGEFLKNATESAICRATVHYVSPNGVAFRFHKPLDATATLEPTPDQLLVSQVGQRKFPTRTGGDVIRHVKVARRGKQGKDDQDSWQFGFDGATEEGGWNHQMIFDTNPLVADENEYEGLASAGDEDLILRVQRFYPWKLYCFDNGASGSGPQIPWRLHECPNIDLGNGVTISGINVALNTLEWPAAAVGESDWWKGYRGAIRRVKIRSNASNGMHYVGARALNYVFGKLDLTSYDFEVFANYVTSNHVGAAMVIPTLYTSPTAPLYNGGLPKWGIIVDYAPNGKSNVAKITVQAMRDW